MNATVNLIRSARVRAEQLSSIIGRAVDAKYLRDLCDCLDERVRLDKASPSGPACEHGFIDTDFCPTCCH